MNRGTDFCNGADYFSRSLGFVIDLTPCGDVTNAISHLIKTCDMSEAEAFSYCNRIRKAYSDSIKAYKGRESVSNG